MDDEPCQHENREIDEPKLTAQWCLDCEHWVQPIGEEDEEGRPSWEVVE